jgi:tRNA pseudouridine32 synthase/23S rRNA pseudouridine746 synthase
VNNLQRFETDVAEIPLPEFFTYPFYYEPHPLAIIAAEQLQKSLQINPWGQPFGLSGEDKPIGKMFGVLVVRTLAGELGYLAAFSGKLADSNEHEGFVPPIFDLLKKTGYFKKEERLINGITDKINSLESSEIYASLCEQKDNILQEFNLLVGQIKEQIRINKVVRKNKRAETVIALSVAEYTLFQESLQEESKGEQIHLKHIIRNYKLKIAEIDEKITAFLNQISELKQQRASVSALLQQRIFTSYTFLNCFHEEKSLLDVFAHTSTPIPPAGAGECAAPKLLQHAFLHQLTPICLAEFWWGSSPISEVRVHGQFYPACRGKCEPILMNHMLKGIILDKNPLLQQAKVLDITVIYEDEFMLVVDKPADFLSVPGKTLQDSVYERIKTMRPFATGPLLVHRLDMSTSGLLVVAKSLDSYKKLQFLFVKRRIHKTYEALLDGVINKPTTASINLPLRLDIDNRPFQVVCYEHGKAATTEYEVREVKDNITRILFKPLTGRTHQLRVHAAHSLGLNCPIVGDDLYGKKGGRLCLHASRLSFIHPFTKEAITLISPTPF